ncbi:hypothetical protein KAW08_02040 [bacterium]|nr:hypothetical protein [bacterium]
MNKKAIFGIVGLLLLVCGLQPVEASHNLITGDSSFETSLSPLAGGAQGSRRYEIDLKEGLDGKKSLKFKGMISLKLIPVEPGKTYTYSFYAKTEKDNLRVSFVLENNGRRKHAGKGIIIHKEWNRYSVTMKAKAKDCRLRLSAGGSFFTWIDACQLEEGDKLTPYKNKEPISIGIYIPLKNNFVFFPEEKIKVDISAYKAWKEAETEDLSLSYQITDFYGNTVEKGEMQIAPDLNKEGRFEKTIFFKPGELGFFVTRVQLKKNKVFISENLHTFAIVREPVKIEKGIEPFCGICGYFDFPGLKRIGVRRIGVAMKWKHIEKTKGVYNWSNLPFSKKKQGYKVKMYLSHLPSVPEWAWDPEDVAYAKTKKIKIPGTGFLPSKEHLRDWREFIHQLAVRYKDVVDIYEIGAEDDLTLGRNPFYLQKYPEEVKNSFCIAEPVIDRYAEMITIAAEEIRKVTPNAKIGAIRPAGYTNKRYTFSEAVFKKCGKEFNLFPLDPYCAPRVIGPGRAPTAMPEEFLPYAFRQTLELGKKYGCNQHIYISEIGYAYDPDIAPDSEYANEMVKRLSRMYLFARMTKNLDSCDWYVANQGGVLEDGCDYSLWPMDGCPRSTVPAYSVVAGVVENVLESKEIYLGGKEIKAVVFKKPNKAEGAVWCIRGEGKITISADPESISLFDVMGNPVKTEIKGKKITFKIGEFPVYLSMTGEGSFMNLCNVISSAKLHVVPVKVYFSAQKINEGILYLENQVNQDSIAEVSISIGEKVLYKTVKNLSKSERIFVKFPLPEDIVNRREDIKAEVDCGKEYEKAAASFPLEFEKVKKVVSSIKIDGNLSEWKKHPYILMNKREQIIPPDPWINWDGSKDLSAKVYVGWDKHNFYLAAEVTDDKHFNNKRGASIWNGDCIQFAFDPLVDGCLRKMMAGYGPDDYNLGIALTKKGHLSYQWHGSDKSLWQGSKFVVARDEANKKTFYEVKIPFVYLGVSPTQGTVFGFSFVIFDDDEGAGQTYWYQLTRGIAGGQDSRHFKKFTLME